LATLSIVKGKLTRFITFLNKRFVNNSYFIQFSKLTQVNNSENEK